jgi:hypothetical protein
MPQWPPELYRASESTFPYSNEAANHSSWRHL